MNRADASDSQGKPNVTLITGSSTGIGFATALHLARQGHRVYASMRDLNRGESLRQAASAERLSMELIHLDVDQGESVIRAVQEVQSREGHIDILVNNAGIAPFGTIELTADSTVKSVFETNFFGALRVIRAVLPQMRGRRSGTIVNVSSVAGQIGPAGMGVYSASKFALEAASEALAQEVLSFGVRVVIIEPGMIVTPILAKALATLPRAGESPYGKIEERLDAMFTRGQQTGGDAFDVARVIESAITSPDPRLRYTAGADAAVMIEGRRRMSDEEWVRMHNPETHEEYFTQLAARFPM